ncbi:MAG: LamG domain-containing protein [Candidatus Poribacteria bacterium]
MKRFIISVFVVVVLIGFFPALGYSAEVADLVFYFPMDEGSGDKITDVSPNKLVAKLENRPKWVQGKIKGALEFTDGKQQGAAAPPSKVLDLGTDDVSLEAWFKTDKSAGQGFIFIKWDGPGYYIKVRDGLLYTRFHDGAAGGELPSKTVVADNKWHHVVAIRKDKTMVQIYLDGKLDVEHKAGAGAGSTDNGADLEIGRYRAERYWNGIIDEIRCWRKALTEEEIQKAMEGTLLSVDAAGKLPVAWGRIKSK